MPGVDSGCLTLSLHSSDILIRLLLGQRLTLIGVNKLQRLGRGKYACLNVPKAQRLRIAGPGTRSQT